MPDIYHDLTIGASPSTVFHAISSPAGLDHWWTKRSHGDAAVGAAYELWFGPEYDWRARVTRLVPDREFELQLTQAHPDWQGSRVGFTVSGAPAGSQLRFYHLGWPTANEHYRVSCYCWAMYLRILKRWLEHGEEVPYERRLDV